MSDTRKDKPEPKDRRHVDREAELDAQERIRKAVADIKWQPSTDGTIVVDGGKTA